MKTIAHTETKVAVSCRQGSDEARLEIVGIADRPGGVEGGIGAQRHELIVRGRLVVERTTVRKTSKTASQVKEL